MRDTLYLSAFMVICSAMKTLDEAFDYFDGEANSAHRYGPSIEEIVANNKVQGLAVGLLADATDLLHTLKEAVAIGVMLGTEMEKRD